MIAGAKLTLPDGNRDHIQGSLDAPIALVEYGDYECPFCGEVYPVITAIQRALGNRLCFAFRHFPLTNVHPHAEHAAEAAEAAGAQGGLITPENIGELMMMSSLLPKGGQPAWRGLAI